MHTGTVASVGNVGEYGFNDAGGLLAWTIEGRDLAGNGVQVRDLRTDVVRVLDSDKAVYRRLAWADSGLALAVLRGRPDSAAADTSYVVLGYTGFGAAVRPVEGAAASTREAGAHASRATRPRPKTADRRP